MHGGSLSELVQRQMWGLGTPVSFRKLLPVAGEAMLDVEEGNRATADLVRMALARLGLPVCLVGLLLTGVEIARECGYCCEYCDWDEASIRGMPPLPWLPWPDREREWKGEASPEEPAVGGYSVV